MVPVEPQVSSELSPAGVGLPSWFVEAHSTGLTANIMVLHPNDAHRAQTLDLFSSIGGEVSPQHHVTMSQLLRMLHVDFRLPVLLDDESSNFMAIHERCKVAATNHEFPFLHSGEFGEWPMVKTKRLLRLHAHVSQLLDVSSWEEDPGIQHFNTILRAYEIQAGGNLPVLVPHHVLEELKNTTQCPFHFAQLDGLLVLDTAPDYTEMERELLLQLSRFVPIHQLLNPGSFRLGHHGAYLLDVHPCKQDGLPDWVPAHELLAVDGDGWNSRSIHAEEAQLSRITVGQREDTFDATLALIDAFRTTSDERILVIDGAAKARPQIWTDALSTLGIRWHSKTLPLNEQPFFHALMHATQISQGMNAWSLSSLRQLITSTSLPLAVNMFPDIQHPLHDDWRPQPHVNVLESIASQFHVLGGPGAIARWLGALSRAKPSMVDRHPEQRQQELEETQWWLTCLLHAWKPLLMSEDLFMLRRTAEGCSTGAHLPTPPSPDSPVIWLNELFSRLDHERLSQRMAPYDHGFGAAQTLLDTTKRVQGMLAKDGWGGEHTGPSFIEMLKFIGEHATLPSLKSMTEGIDVMTPEGAHGCQAGLIILAGMDVDAWSMKSPQVPWFDAQAQLQLGVFQTDSMIRRGRHHLRHLLNAAPHVIVFDSTPEEGGGPSAPLAEWLNEVRKNGEWDAMREPPVFLDDVTYQGESHNRRWTWKVREEGHGSWLSPLRGYTLQSNETRRHIRRGYRPRDGQQQVGLDLQQRLPLARSVNHAQGIMNAFEGSLQADRHRRQPRSKDLETGSTLAWEMRHHMMSTDAVRIKPSSLSAVKISGLGLEPWPHLGQKPNKTSSLAVDPRPLPPYAPLGLEIQHRLGHLGEELTRPIWSPSRLEAWLKCPRMAWAKQYLGADAEQGDTPEDIDLRMRGILLHEVEGALLAAHGLSVGGEELQHGEALHAGPVGSPEAGWHAILAHLVEHAPWLGKHHAVSVHRTRDLLNMTSEDWRAFQEEDVEPEIAGRLGRLLLADLELHHAAPIACEWRSVASGELAVTIDATNEEGGSAPFSLSGWADRVDVVILPETVQKHLEERGLIDGNTTHTTPYPMDGSSRAAQRFVIIRDLKSVRGPTAQTAGLRHMGCLFQDLQLALYARAWELTHPNDRVVGVGATEIGEFTQHYVELDTDVSEPLKDLEFGTQTHHLIHHFPSTEDEALSRSSFRTWMQERLKVARRAITAAQSGHVNPTPSSACGYCPIRTSCSVSSYDGRGF